MNQKQERYKKKQRRTAQKLNTERRKRIAKINKDRDLARKISERDAREHNEHIRGVAL